MARWPILFMAAGAVRSDAIMIEIRRFPGTDGVACRTITTEMSHWPVLFMTGRAAGNICMAEISAHPSRGDMA